MIKQLKAIKGYSLTKWNAKDRYGVHAQYGVWFMDAPLQQQPFRTLHEARKTMQQHFEYEKFKRGRA